jgi:hypothetical protein
MAPSLEDEREPPNLPRAIPGDSGRSGTSIGANERRGDADHGSPDPGGAGAPPPGTHGRNHGPDRSRLAGVTVSAGRAKGHSRAGDHGPADDGEAQRTR